MYTHFISPDFMRTTDSRVIEYTQNWFDDIISKSVQISEQGEKNRKRFFKFLLSKIEDLTLRIEKHVETATRSARV